MSNLKSGMEVREVGYHLSRTCEVQVWAENLYQEFARIRELIEKYSYVAVVCNDGIMNRNYSGYGIPRCCASTCGELRDEYAISLPNVASKR